MTTKEKNTVALLNRGASVAAGEDVLRTVQAWAAAAEEWDALIGALAAFAENVPMFNGLVAEGRVTSGRGTVDPECALIAGEVVRLMSAQKSGSNGCAAEIRRKCERALKLLEVSPGRPRREA